MKKNMTERHQRKAKQSRNVLYLCIIQCYGNANYSQIKSMDSIRLLARYCVETEKPILKYI